MSRKSQPKKSGFKPFLYRGMFRCGECGCFITTEAKTKRHKCGTVHHYTYCRCTKRVKPCSQPCVREEQVSTQITAVLSALAVPTDWTKWMLAELEAEQRQDTQATVSDITSFQQRIREIDQKIERLTDAYLCQALSLDEFREAKGKLIAEKQGIKEQKTRVEANRVSRLEPVIGFVKALEKASAEKETRSEIGNRDFFRKVGSNLLLKDGEVSWMPRDAWQTLIDHGPFARTNVAA